MVEKRRGGSLSVLGEIWSDFGGVLETVVPRSDVYADASRKGLPVAFLAGKVSPEARRFEILAAEVEQLMARTTEEQEHGERAERQLL